MQCIAGYYLNGESRSPFPQHNSHIRLYVLTERSFKNSCSSQSTQSGQIGLGRPAVNDGTAFVVFQVIPAATHYFLKPIPVTHTKRRPGRAHGRGGCCQARSRNAGVFGRGSCRAVFAYSSSLGAAVALPVSTIPGSAVAVTTVAVPAISIPAPITVAAVPAAVAAIPAAVAAIPATVAASLAAATALAGGQAVAGGRKRKGAGHKAA